MSTGATMQSAAKDDTIPRLLRRNALRIPDRPAIREKNFGIWRTLTWREYYARVQDIACGLAALGFKRGDALAIIGDNRPMLYASLLAAQCLGGRPVPLYQDAIATELEYVLEHAEIRIVIAEDQEQVDKMLALRERLPGIKEIIFTDRRGMFQYRHEGLRSLDDVIALGHAWGAKNAGTIEAAIEQGSPDDIALICYTSGTTGRPKGAMLSHGNLIAAAAGFIANTDLRETDDWIAFLPMAWIGDTLYSLVVQIMTGLAANCPESPETVQRDLRELGPTAFLAPPRIWENLLTLIQVRAGDASFLKRHLFEFFRDRAIEAELRRSEGKPVPARLRISTALGEFLVYGPVRDQYGLRRARLCLTGGAPLGGDTFRFFRGFGVNLKQIYGSTELAAFCSIQPDGEASPNTVGKPAAGIEVRIADGGEVLVRGGNVFRGYLKQDEATREALDKEGWFHTGDAGFFDPAGHLVIIDRAKDVGKLTDGTPFAPQFIENKLKFSPYIGEAIAFGDGRSSVMAMIAMALVPVGNWAERRGLAYTSYQDLSQKPEVRALIRAEVAKCNAGLPPATRVKRILMLAKDFDADDAEITRTRKLRRRFIAEKYEQAIAALYGGKSETALATDITYEDGRRATVTATVAIEDVEAPAKELANV